MIVRLLIRNVDGQQEEQEIISAIEDQFDVDVELEEEYEE